MIYPIVIYGNAVLKKVAEPINKDYPELRLDTDFEFINERKSTYLFLLNDALA